MRTIYSNLTIYGIAHGLVDALCAGVLFSILSEQIFSLATTTYLFLVYNLLAFGLQVIFGFLVDYFKAPRLFALLGIVITSISPAIMHLSPVVSVVIAGIGNALFHVGGGVVSLNLTPRKATAPGIFVGPGALGLLAGTLLGRSGNFTFWPFLPVMAILAVMIFLIPRPVMYREQSISTNSEDFKFEYIIYLVLFVIAIRSLVGAVIIFPWKSDTNLLIILTLFIALGKGLGGFLADKFGWKLVSVGSLIMSIPLLTLGISFPVMAMIGMFLFNITMPITLTLISNMIPGRPGVSFGLTCLALVLGTLPAFSGIKPGLSNLVFIDAVILLSAVSLYFCLRLYFRIRAIGGVSPGSFSDSKRDRKLPNEE